MSNCDVLNSPIRFLGATVLSFNTTLGLGASESTLSVDLVEDCENGDLFQPSNGLITVGDSVYFGAGTFTFGGILKDWNLSQGGGGKTFKVNISDPRQLLENCVVVIDSYLGLPTTANNYINVYRHYEGKVLDGSCNSFGTSKSTERGMPYTKIIEGLTQMNPTIYAPTGSSYTINWSSFPQGIPEYFKIPGPSVTILQLLSNVCDVLGYEFYVELLAGNNINIGLISLNSQPSSFEGLVSMYNGTAIELSYGQELRNEVTKTVLFGQQQYYASIVKRFQHYFGSDLVNGKYEPVVPIARDQNDCGFWLNKKTNDLDASLTNKIGDGPYLIHELDIRAALSNMDLWILRVCDKNAAKPAGLPGTMLNTKIKDIFFAGIADILKDVRDAMKTLEETNQDNDATPEKKKEAETKVKHSIDALIQPHQGILKTFKNKEKTKDLDIIFNWVRNLGTTYYGKQFIAPLEHPVCYNRLDDNAELTFSDVPTNEGAWIEYTGSVLGLSEPDLSFFRQTDGRVEPFALYNVDGAAPDKKPNNQPEPEKLPKD